MKKLFSIMLGLSLLLGSAALTFGQDDKKGDDSKSEKKGKKKGKKKEDAPAPDKK